MPCLFYTSYGKNSFTGFIYVAQHSLSCYMKTLSYKMVVSNNISVPHPKVELKICTTFIITYLKYFKQIYITLQFIP